MKLRLKGSWGVRTPIVYYFRQYQLLGSWHQGCQFHFGRCFVFLIRMKCFSFRVYIIQIQDKLIINYAIQHAMPNKYNFKI